MLRNWLNRLFRNPKQAQALILVFVLLLLTAWATKCRADGAQVFSVGSTYLRGPTPSISAFIAKPLGVRDASLEVGVTLNGAAGGNPNQMAVEARMVDGLGKFDVGLGVAYLQNTDEYNGSHLDFNLLVRYHVSRDWAVAVSHWSNAGTVEPNLGRDMIRLERWFR